MWVKVPENYNFEKAEDYALHEQDVIHAVNWLTDTPIDRDLEKRNEVNAFLMKWMMGSPTVEIEIREDIVTFVSSPDLLMAFLGGWTKFSLETRAFDDPVKANMAGIENAITLYQKNRKIIGKNKEIEKYIKLQSNGKLEREIAKRVGK